MRPASPRGKEVNEQEQAQMAANSAAWLKDHRPTLLVNAGGVEAWRFKDPRCTNLAFDIVVTRFGMSVFGDMDGLIWNVGASYGIDFLRHQSMGYVHEKLERDSRREVIDFDGIRDTVCNHIIELAEEALGEDEIPEWMGVIPNSGTTRDHAEELVEWMKLYVEDDRLPFDDLIDVVEDIDSFADGRDSECVLAYDFLSQHEDLLGGSDLWESSFSKPCPQMMQRLYHVRYAANQIMAMKELGSPAL